MMRSVLRSEDFRELVVVREYPDGIGTIGGLQERDRELTYGAISGREHEVVLEGMIVVHRDERFSRDLIIEVEHSFPFLKMQFELEGHSDFSRSSKGSLDTDILHGRHQLFYFPEVKGKLRYPKGHRYTLEIILSPDYLKKLFREDLSPLHHFGRGLDTNTPVRFHRESLPITPAMKQSILDFIHCPYAGAFRKIYLEAKILELLTLQVDQFTRYGGGREATTLRKDEVEKLNYVREWLEANLETDLSLGQMAALAGLNEYSLKKGFRELFHTTVFAYLTDLRMEHARWLIREKGIPVAEAAFSVGYRNPQHFTTAFKRKFGYLPKMLK